MCAQTHTCSHRLPDSQINGARGWLQELPSHLESSTVSEHCFQYLKSTQTQLCFFFFRLFFCTYCRPQLMIKEDHASWYLAWITSTSPPLNPLLFSHSSLKIRSFVIKSHSFFQKLLPPSFVTFHPKWSSDLYIPARVPFLVHHQGSLPIPQCPWNWQGYS